MEHAVLVRVLDAAQDLVADLQAILGRVAARYSGSPSRSLAMTDSSVSPSTYFMTKKYWPSSSTPTSWMGTMLGCSSCPTVRISSAKRKTAPTSLCSGRSRLTATRDRCRGRASASLRPGRRRRDAAAPGSAARLDDDAGALAAAATRGSTVERASGGARRRSRSSKRPPRSRRRRAAASPGCAPDPSLAHLGGAPTKRSIRWPYGPDANGRSLTLAHWFLPALHIRRPSAGCVTA